MPVPSATSGVGCGMVRCSIPAGAYRIVEVGPDGSWLNADGTSEKIGQVVVPCQMYLWDDGWVGFDSNETSVHQCKLEPTV